MAVKKRSSKATRGRRTTEVYRMLLAGKRRDEILQHVVKARWRVCVRTVDSLIATATAMIEAEATVDRAREFSIAKQRLENMYALAMERNDLGNARLALMELHKLLSLYMPPAPQTLRLLGVDYAQLEDVVKMLHGAGYDPSDVFNSMLVELAEAKERKDHDA